MYNKLFSKIVTSSVWLAPSDHRVVWFTFLALMDQDGFVPIASVPNLALTANVPVESAAAAVKAFESPDLLDPAQEFEGRRIEKVPNGWMVLNAGKYAAMATAEKAREQTRTRVQAFRERKRNARVTQGNGNVTPSDQIRSDQINSESTHAYPAESLHVAITRSAVTSRRDDDADPLMAWETVKAAYPKFAGRQDWISAEHHCQRLVDQGLATWADLLAGVERYRAYVDAGGVSGPEYVLTPAKFFSAPDKPWTQPWEISADADDPYVAFRKGLEDHRNGR